MICLCLIFNDKDKHSIANFAFNFFVEVFNGFRYVIAIIALFCSEHIHMQMTLIASNHAIVVFPSLQIETYSYKCPIQMNF